MQVKVDEFIEMVSTTVETYAQLFSDGDMTTFSSDDEAHFVLALSGVITSMHDSTCLSDTGFPASWKVMGFTKGIFQAWKVMENDCGPELSMGPFS